MNQRFGLKNSTIEKIESVFRQYSAIEKAVLYGSRAKGNYRDGSDIDLTLFGEDLGYDLLGSLTDNLDDLLLPYTFDISIYDQLKNDNLREHIDRVGKVFYLRENELSADDHGLTQTGNEDSRFQMPGRSGAEREGNEK
jgi:predicted nucleotidyltransferase